MNISELINTSGIINRAFEQPAMKIKPRSQKRPDIDTALKAVQNQIEKEVSADIAEQVREVLQDAYENHVLMYGSHEDAENKDEWESAVDDLVENTIEPWVPVLSQDWLGRMTIGAGLHSENGVQNFSQSLGKEYYKQLVHGKTPLDVMASAGVEKQSIVDALALHLQSTPKEKTMSDNEQSAEFAALIEKMANYLGKDPDNIMEVYNDIDSASDSDDILAHGAAPRLGLDEQDVEVLRMERLMHGEDLPDVVLKAMEAYHEGTGKKKGGKKASAKAPAAPKEPKAPKAKAAPKAEATPDKVLPAEVLIALKECGAKDEDMGKKLGVSRATYNGYANGKVLLEPDDNQRNAVRDELVDRLNKLHEALAAVDGGEAHVVF